MPSLNAPDGPAPEPEGEALWLSQAGPVRPIGTAESLSLWLGPYLVVAAEADLHCLAVAPGLSRHAHLATLADDRILALCGHAAGARVWTAHRSGLIRQLSAPGLEVERSLKTWQRGPIPHLAVDPTGGQLVSISVGLHGSLKVWDLARLSGSRAPRALPHHPTAVHMLSRGPLAVGTVAGSIYLYASGDLSLAPRVLASHKSAVAALASDELWLASAGRDRVLTLWRRSDWTAVHVIPVFEDLASLTVGPGGLVLTGGASGRLRAWRPDQGREVDAPMTRPTLPDRVIASLDYFEDDLRLIQGDLVYTGLGVECLFQDPLTDLCLIRGSFVVLATLASALKVMDWTSGRLAVFDTRHPKGVLGLTAAQSESEDGRLASMGQAREIFVWRLDESGRVLDLLHECTHAAAITRILLLDRLLYSGDSDGILKAWALEPDQAQARTLATCLAHPKELKALDFRASHRLILTASLDKTAKVWRAEDMQPVATLAGHRRGVIAAQFAPFEPQIITASADGAIKLWSIGPYTCSRTLEGLVSPACDLLFFSPKVLLTLSVDGAFTVWQLSESVPKLGSFNRHADQAWKLARIGDRVISCGSDNQILVWEDNSKALKRKSDDQMATQVKLMQTLDNALRQGKLDKAVLACLRLKQTRRLHEILVDAPEATRKTLIARIPTKYLHSLLSLSVKLNQNTRTFALGQEIFHILVKRGQDLNRMEPAQIYQFMSFSQKHYERISKEMAKHPYNMAYSLQKKDDSSGLTRSEIFEMLERLKRYIPLDESRSIRASNGLYPDYGPMRTPVKDSDGLLDQFVQTFQAMGNQVGGPRVRSTFDDESRGDLVTLNHLIRGI
eukprot:maker-scaffold169_size292178-snap-gene-1.34 protein:Tk07942 transcript:maker-scaffold169_size292178-snap-gene-1.34-mRNA-1 annotation:"transducin beta-like protein 3"